MARVIVAFPKMEDSKNIKNILVHNGIEVIAACTSGSYVLNMTGHLDSGVIVCGYKLADMMCADLTECLPKGFRVLMVSSEQKWHELENKGEIVFLATPLKAQNLVDTVNMMIQTNVKQKGPVRVNKRSEEDKMVIHKAKVLLMEKNAMSEEEAHRYLQKNSMDSGNSMLETARMVISFYE